MLSIICKEVNDIFSVEDVGKEEESLFKQMPLEGHIEQRDKYLINHGLYGAWRGIYTKYVNLACQGDLEALKRAIFFAWYQLSEPSWLSGISELPDSQTKKVVNLLENQLEQGLCDSELDFMLPYYMSVCDYYLERFYPLPNIEEASSYSSDNARILAENSDWKLRGQMGAYWE